MRNFIYRFIQLLKSILSFGLLMSNRKDTPTKENNEDIELDQSYLTPTGKTTIRRKISLDSELLDDSDSSTDKDNTITYHTPSHVSPTDNNQSSIQSTAYPENTLSVPKHDRKIVKSIFDTPPLTEDQQNTALEEYSKTITVEKTIKLQGGSPLEVTTTDSNSTEPKNQLVAESEEKITKATPAVVSNTREKHTKVSAEEVKTALDDIIKRNKGSPNLTVQTAKMAQLKITISDICNIVPEFDGNPSELEKFISCGKLLFMGTVDAEEKKIFLSAVQARLKGAAFEAVRHKTFAEWEDLVTELKLNFKEKITRKMIQNELMAAKQLPRESVNEFGDKVVKILNHLNAVTYTSIDKADVQNHLVNENKMLAIQTFEDGLRSKDLKILVKARGESDLHDLIHFARTVDTFRKR